MSRNYIFQSILLFASLLILGWFVNNISGILAPFIVAIVISYFLAPFVGLLQRHKIPRTLGTVTAMALLLVFACVISMTILPMLYKQISVLISLAISHSTDANNALRKISQNLDMLDPEMKNKLQDSLLGLFSEVMDFALLIIKNLLHSGSVAINVISLVFITPIVLFYTLRDWNIIISSIKSLIPYKYSNIANRLFEDIDKCLAGFIRGQAIVCITLGTYYAIALSLVGVDSGFALGMISGILTFIPYAGALFSGFLCVFLTVIKFADIYHPLIVMLIFILGQIVEGNFLVPKLVGENVNLHPVWIMFGLMAGGALLGFIGVLIALPLTAIIGVVTRFTLSYYYQSHFYVKR